MAGAEPLAADFPAVSQADWRRLVAKAIEPRKYDDLIARSDDGIAVGPIYARPRETAILEGMRRGPWAIAQRIDHADWGLAIGQIAEDLVGGAEAVELVFATSPSARGGGLPPPGNGEIERFLAFLGQRKIAVRIDAGEATVGTGAMLTKAASKIGQPLDLTLVFDPIATLAAAGWLAKPYAEIGHETALDAMRDGVRTAMVADGRPWNAAGASEVQELAAVTAAFIANWRLLTGRGMAPEAAARKIGVVLAADSDQFLTIAKFRAARQILAHAIGKAVEAPVRVPIHAETAWRMMSRRSVHTNILRTTIAVFAAGIGGADSITVLPFTAAVGVADTFARRLVRNTQTVLLAEANLARAADPGAGSGAIEALTAELAQKAWEKFRVIEAAGGLLAAVRDGSFQREIAATRVKRQRRLATGETALVGTTLYPEPAGAAPLSARPQAAPPGEGGESVEPLNMARLAEPFET